MLLTDCKPYLSSLIAENTNILPTELFLCLKENLECTVYDGSDVASDALYDVANDVKGIEEIT